MKKLLIVLVLTAFITGCASYPAASEYSRGYYKPYPNFLYNFFNCYSLYTKHGGLF
jgi:uncharacterized protein YceK